MQVDNAAQSRPQFYDRTAVATVGRYVGAAIAPHALTNRINITIASTAKAWFDLFFMLAVREAAAAAVGSVEVTISYTPSGGTATRFGLIQHTSNTVGALQQGTVAALGFLSPGDGLIFQTIDPSTGGTVNYWLSAKYTTFDN